MSNTRRFIGALKEINRGVMENDQQMACYYGRVMQNNPLKIQVDQRFILDEDFLILTQSVYGDEGLRTGDKVILLREQGGQHYVVLDKVVIG